LQSEPRPYGLMTKVDVESSRYLGRIRVFREPPLPWSAIVGDTVQNLRAALDHLVWVLVRANGHQPSNSNAFPIFDQMPPKKRGHRERERWNRQVHGLHPSVIRFIELCQPYKGPSRPSGHVLAGLRTLSNEDKHRTLLPAFAAIPERTDALKLDVVELRDIEPPLKGGEFRAGRPLKNGDLVFEAPVKIIGPNPEVKLKGNLSLDIGFGRKPVPMKGFVQMGDLVTRILAHSRAFLGE